MHICNAIEIVTNMARERLAAMEYDPLLRSPDEFDEKRDAISQVEDFAVNHLAEEEEPKCQRCEHPSSWLMTHTCGK